MQNFWKNFLIEIGLLTFLGILYYFYQKRKIVRYEENKGPLIMGLILQSCLSEKRDAPQPLLDQLILSLDDYLHNRSGSPPLALLSLFMNSEECSPELRDVISEGISEMEEDRGKK